MYLTDWKRTVTKHVQVYNEVIRSVGGIDMQLLGIGGNGHIGFNNLEKLLRRKLTAVDLTESTHQGKCKILRKYG